ncbi:MAG: response regulator [Elusimicrobiota bacterium]
MPKKIMIVEDSHSINEIIKNVLEDAGYEAVPVYTGVEATRTAPKEKPDLILLDILLPGGNGEVVYSQLKQLYVTKDKPIIIITSEDPANLAEFILRTGFDENDILFKPLDFDKLLKKISELMPA